MHLHSCGHPRKAYNACHKVNVDYIFQITGYNHTIVLNSYSLAVDLQDFQRHFVFLKIGSLLACLDSFFYSHLNPLCLMLYIWLFTLYLENGPALSDGKKQTVQDMVHDNFLFLLETTLLDRSLLGLGFLMQTQTVTNKHEWLILSTHTKKKVFIFNKVMHF